MLLQKIRKWFYNHYSPPERRYVKFIRRWSARNTYYHMCRDEVMLEAQKMAGCQGLAVPWYARRERGAVETNGQWFNGSKVQMRTRVQARQKTRGNNELQVIDEDKTKDQLQLLPDTYS